jgi:hypothetical protein
MIKDQTRTTSDIPATNSELGARAWPFIGPSALVIGYCVLALFNGCGYSQSGDEPKGGYQWRSLYRQDVKTVAVGIFGNKDFTQGVEFSLSKAIINQLEAHSPYKVVPPERADTILEGTITSIGRQVISKNSETAVPEEQLDVINVDFVWKDLRSGRILVQRRNFSQTATYYPTLGEGQFVGNQLAVERLALAIVQELQADW